MNIQQAKQELEKRIIFHKGILGIGIINDEKGNEAIEIAIELALEIVLNDFSNDKKLKLIFHNKKWYGFPVVIVKTEKPIAF